MWSTAAVLVCALELMGRSAGSFPPIVILDERPVDVSPQAEAFVRSGEGTIYLLSSAAVLDRARRAKYKCGELNALRKIASVLVHEEWHVENGPDERGAYEAQLMALTTMKAGPGTPVYAGVERAMRVTMAERSRSAALRAMAAR